MSRGVPRDGETTPEGPEHGERGSGTKLREEGGPATDDAVEHLQVSGRAVGEGAGQSAHAERAAQQDVRVRHADHEELPGAHLGGHLVRGELEKVDAVAEGEVADDRRRDVARHDAPLGSEKDRTRRVSESTRRDDLDIAASHR
jgi:hypothetical protein